MSTRPALLALADGTVYEGLSIGAAGDCVGELVFNTSMTGYQEMITDPSYHRQIITLTAPHIGNTGCNDEDMESNKAWAAGLVIRDCSILASNFRANISFPDWLKKYGIVAISGIDTRALTLKIREYGAISSCITTDADREQALVKAKSFKGLNDMDLASEVSRKTIERWHEGQGVWAAQQSEPQRTHVVAYDFGIKHNILRILYDKGCHVTLVPAKTPAAEVIAMNPDGVFLSNGPGDPKACTYAITAAQELMAHNIPLFGICLGFQILALASGAKTVKMKFGHHGSNHPVIEAEGKKRVFITSQNHGFAVEEASLPDELVVTHRSLFDQSLQGFRHKSKPVFGFQGHPEASPGPHDIEMVFAEFITSMKK